MVFSEQAAATAAMRSLTGERFYDRDLVGGGVLSASHQCFFAAFLPLSIPFRCLFYTRFVSFSPAHTTYVANIILQDTLQRIRRPDQPRSIPRSRRYRSCQDRPLPRAGGVRAARAGARGGRGGHGHGGEEIRGRGGGPGWEESQAGRGGRGRGGDGD